MTDLRRLTVLAAALLIAGLAQAQHAEPIVSATKSTLQPGDFIAAVVNQDIVAASEVTARMEQIRQQERAKNQPVPLTEELRKLALDAMIDDRAMVTFARENANRVDEAELDRVVGNVAAQNKVTMAELAERLKADGMDMKRFRENLRDQIMTERVRDHEVQGRIRITDTEIDAWLDKRREALANGGQLNIQQILVTVPDNAPDAVLAERRARAEAALKAVQAGQDFAAVNKEYSEDGNKAQGGVVGLRPVERLPDVFVDAVKGLKSGELLPKLVRSGAGFHILKVVERSGSNSLTEITQTHARHILLRPSAQMTMQQASQRLAEFKREIEAGHASFENLARQFSEDGSAAQGGDLGWASPGNFVPEFEQAMNGLAINGISEPIPSRYGVHLIQVTERRQAQIDMKQLREQARSALREQKFDAAYQDWVKELRSKAYIETREWLD
ncbi:MAG: peptidylprolyl isomerase [Paucibacter sp.]|nr:peptidylprolyl isomerase [Roseateles sp.]